jgi:hypothetical protein
MLERDGAGHRAFPFAFAFIRMRDPATQKIRHFAERLLANEATAATPSEANVPVAFRVCEKLGRPLTTLAGTSGFQSLLLRALTLAKREAPSLAAVQLNAGRLLQDDVIKPPLDAHNDGEVLLMSHLLGLLFTFIGETLTLRLILDVWPYASFNSLSTEGTEEREPQG